MIVASYSCHLNHRSVDSCCNKKLGPPKWAEFHRLSNCGRRREAALTAFSAFAAATVSVHVRTGAALWSFVTPIVAILIVEGSLTSLFAVALVSPIRATLSGSALSRSLAARRSLELGNVDRQIAISFTATHLQ